MQPHVQRNFDNMNSIKLFLLASVTIVLASCASLSKSECLSSDWQAIGYKDGSWGRDASHVKKHGETCSELGVELDDAAYKTGYEAGLTTFCTADKGYWLGETGQKYKDVCPPELADDYLRGYNKGHHLYWVLQGID